MPRFLMPERRRGVRIVTLKNFGAFILIAVGLFAAVELVERARRPAPGDYGRVIGKQLPQAVSATRAPEVVTEGEITDQTAVDPMLVAPAARSQYLGSPELPKPPLARSAAAEKPAVPAVSRDAYGVAIGGEVQGVTVVVGKSATPMPQLAGGIFKP